MCLPMFASSFPLGLAIGQTCIFLKPLDGFFRSFMELSKIVVVQRHGYLPNWPTWAYPWARANISGTAGWTVTVQLDAFWGIVQSNSCAMSGHFAHFPHRVFPMGQIMGRCETVAVLNVGPPTKPTMWCMIYDIMITKSSSLLKSLTCQDPIQAYLSAVYRI